MYQHSKNDYSLHFLNRFETLFLTILERDFSIVFLFQLIYTVCLFRKTDLSPYSDSNVFPYHLTPYFQKRIIPCTRDIVSVRLFERCYLGCIRSIFLGPSINIVVLSTKAFFRFTFRSRFM